MRSKRVEHDQNYGDSPTAFPARLGRLLDRRAGDAYGRDLGPVRDRVPPLLELLASPGERRRRARGRRPAEPGSPARAHPWRALQHRLATEPDRPDPAPPPHRPALPRREPRPSHRDAREPMPTPRER